MFGAGSVACFTGDAGDRFFRLENIRCDRCCGVATEAMLGSIVIQWLAESFIQLGWRVRCLPDGNVQGAQRTVVAQAAFCVDTVSLEKIRLSDIAFSERPFHVAHGGGFAVAYRILNSRGRVDDRVLIEGVPEIKLLMCFQNL